MSSNQPPPPGSDPDPPRRSMSPLVIALGAIAAAAVIAAVVLTVLLVGGGDDGESADSTTTDATTTESQTETDDGTLTDETTGEDDLTAEQIALIDDLDLSARQCRDGELEPQPDEITAIFCRTGRVSSQYSRYDQPPGELPDRYTAILNGPLVSRDQGDGCSQGFPSEGSWTFEDEQAGRILCAINASDPEAPTAVIAWTYDDAQIVAFAASDEGINDRAMYAWWRDRAPNPPAS